jgi:hypothetical protein
MEEKMLIATGIKRNEWQREKQENFEMKFHTLGDLHHFIAYNYATIITLSFTGKLETGEK